MTLRFSANLGFLWTELALPDAIAAARRAGFHAVECHWPYAVPADDVAAALRRTGLWMLGLNTRPGDLAAGDFGLTALPERGAEAEAALEEAITYARATGTRAVHVMAGKVDGGARMEVFGRRLGEAAQQAPDLTFLVEPINGYDVPGYLIDTPEAARETIGLCGATNVRMMFDLYHMGRMGRDLITTFDECRDVVAHVQFAAIPSRGAPDAEDTQLLPALRYMADEGWNVPFGAEYKPGGATEPTLGWLRAWSKGRG
ncbi:hydroxypyruvate isomerase family protein [Pseudaestuariivita sp.]|uniref:hydroxypyruvate isomerase family protein n=1 Tax=Pseudaestuariivita sp. TaxID=2211669 RepID=UPI00405912A1